MKPKTLHQIQHLFRSGDGRVAHLYHRRGRVRYSGNEQMLLPDESAALPLSTNDQKLAAYGAIAAGDRMIPYENTVANKSLLTALRVATGTRIMSMAHAYNEPPALGPLAIDGNTGVYYRAIEAMRHYGTANSSKMLDTVQKYIRNCGLAYQAKLLQPMIEAAVEMALEHRGEELDAFYRAFHDLYGTELNPNPKRPEKKPEEKTPQPKATKPSIGSPELQEGEVPWGTLEGVYRLPMEPWKHPKIRSQAFWKYSAFGTFKYPWRALPSSDYQCFSIKRRTYGGTLLIDMSGSMQIQMSEVKQVLDIAPHATIACYASLDESQTHGRIYVLAEHSKVGDANRARRELGGENVIDGPALRWLATQSQPRIWVSDGKVTGYGARQTVNLVDDVARITHGARISRVGSLKVLLEKLNGQPDKKGAFA